jgi:hypothetical protein
MASFNRVGIAPRGARTSLAGARGPMTSFNRVGIAPRGARTSLAGARGPMGTRLNEQRLRHGKRKTENGKRLRMAETAVPKAVAEIDRQADDTPNNEAQPVMRPESSDQIEIGQHA